MRGARVTCPRARSAAGNGAARYASIIRRASARRARSDPGGLGPIAPEHGRHAPTSTFHRLQGHVRRSHSASDKGGLGGGAVSDPAGSARLHSNLDNLRLLEERCPDEIILLKHAGVRPWSIQQRSLGRDPLPSHACPGHRINVVMARDITWLRRIRPTWARAPSTIFAREDRGRGVGVGETGCARGSSARWLQWPWTETREGVRAAGPATRAGAP